MNIMTKSELKGKKYKCLRIIKGYAIEDIAEMSKNIYSQIEAQGGRVTEDESGWSFGSQFIMKPKQKREQIGLLDCTKSYADFDGVRIEYKDIDLHAGLCSFETSNATYSIHGLI